LKRKLSSSPVRSIDLLSYLSERFTYYSDWKEALSLGSISVNGEIVYENRLLSPGETVEFLPEHIYEPPVDTEWKILYEDDKILVVHKPGDLPVHPAGRYKENTLLRLIEKKFPNQKFYTIHRLDRETSGIVLFAKDKLAAKKLSRDFCLHRIVKKYLVWVYGEFPEGLQVCRGFLSSDPGTIIRKKLKFTPDSSGNVMTYFQRLSFQKGISLLIAEPVTGKTHQIRATLYSIGYPVLGDKIYGKRDTAFLDFIETGQTLVLSEELGYSRQALHALSLEFNHPGTGARMELVSPFPEIWI